MRCRFFVICEKPQGELHQLRGGGGVANLRGVAPRPVRARVKTTEENLLSFYINTFVCTNYPKRPQNLFS